MLTIEDEEYCAPRYDHLLTAMKPKGKHHFVVKWGLLHELHDQTIFVCFVICHFTACIAFGYCLYNSSTNPFFNESFIMHRLYIISVSSCM